MEKEFEKSVKEIERLVKERKEIAKKSLLLYKFEIEQVKRNLEYVRKFFVEETKSCNYGDIVEWLEKETQFNNLMQEINLLYTLAEHEKNEEQERFFQSEIDSEIFKLLNI